MRCCETSWFFYYLVLGCLLGTYLFCRGLVDSRFGRVFRGAKENAVRMETIGFDVFRFQLTGYVIAGVLAGFSGFPARQCDRVRQPRLHVMATLGRAVIMVILGGLGSLHGAIRRHGRLSVSGGMALRLHRELEGHLRTHACPGRPVCAGADCWADGTSCADGLPPSKRHSRVTEPVLRLEKLRKRFGGLLVTDDVTLDVMPGELHAIIGPNGAGKTTLINQISGLLACDDGPHLIRRPRHHGLARAPARALGLARSFQVTPMLSGFSVLENVALAVQARCGTSFRLTGRARRNGRSTTDALAVLDEVGSAELPQRPRGRARTWGKARA